MAADDDDEFPETSAVTVIQSASPIPRNNLNSELEEIIEERSSKERGSKEFGFAPRSGGQSIHGKQPEIKYMATVVGDLKNDETAVIKRKKYNRGNSFEIQRVANLLKNSL